MRGITHLVGVDEAGRGPLAGPVAVGVVCVSADFDWRRLSQVDDSKLLSKTKREAIYAEAKQLQKEGVLEYRVSMVSAPVIDRMGITKAVSLATKRGISRLTVKPNETQVKLDGLLKAPEEFVFQETIIKGDQKEKVIGLASIMAKVARDRYMVRLSRRFPQYGFEYHKGYGTKSHQNALGLYGLCPYHRRSFTKRYRDL